MFVILIFIVEMRSVERGICPIAPLALRLTLYLLTGSRVWPHWNHRCPFLLVVCWRQVTISRGCQDIEPQTFRVTTFTLSGDMKSLEPQLVVSYWSSTNTVSLSHTIAEILSVKNNWVTSLTHRFYTFFFIIY